MLVLTRQQGESIILGDNIFIKVLETGGEPSSKVRIAIDAPDDIDIVRTEILLTRKELREKLDGMRSTKVGKRIKKEIQQMETAANTPAEESVS